MKRRKTMKTIIAALIATFVVAGANASAWAGQELRDGVRSGAMIHPHGVWGAYDQGFDKNGR
jgi:hypothetical protein